MCKIIDYLSITGDPNGTPTPAPAGRSSGGMTFQGLQETERAEKFEELYNTIRELIDKEPSKEDLRNEGRSLMRRLASARTRSGLAQLLGASGNPVATVMATAAAEEEKLLSYMLDTFIDSPQQYLKEKRKQTLSDLAGFLQGAGQFLATGGRGKAEAANALANMAMAGAQRAQADAMMVQAKTQKAGEGSNSIELLMAYSEAMGGNLKDKDPVYRTLRDMVNRDLGEPEVKQ